MIGTKKLSALLLACLMMASTLVACGDTDASTDADSNADSSTDSSADADTDADAGDKTVVRVRSGWQEVSLPNWAAAIETYETENPTVDIELEFTPAGDDAMAKLSAEFLSGDTPDIVQAWKTFFNEYVADGLVEPLTDKYESEGWLEDGVMVDGTIGWSAGLPDATKENPEIYGVADFVATSVIYYNTKMFADLGIEEPSDLDGLIEASKTITDAGYKAMVVPGGSANIVDLLAAVQVQLTGVDFLIDIAENGSSFDDPTVQQSFDVIQRMIDEGVIDKSSMTYTEEDCIADFVGGNAAMFKMHTAYNTNLMAAQAETEGFEYSVFKKMDFVENPVEDYSCTYGAMWMIPAASEVKDEAKDFLFYIFGEDVATDSVANCGRITTLTGPNEGVSDVVSKVLVEEQLPTLSTDSFYLIDMISGSALSAFTASLQGMLEGSMDSEEALDQAVTLIDQAAAQG